MSGEKNLQTLLAGLSAELAPDVFVFTTCAHEDVPAGLEAQMRFEEAEGVTLIMRKSEAKAHGLAFEFPSRMITLNIHSALDAVGFLARITTELARCNMGVNPVAGFYHDHLFVPEDRADDALDVLKDLARSAAEAGKNL
ncbi:MAG: ACT domain-containing protein [Pseudomonadota bacterium]